MKWGYRWADESPFGLWSHFTIAGMVFGMMTFSLAYLGFLFVSSSQSHAWQGLRASAFSVVLYVSALMGSRYWYNYLEYPPGWRALFILSPLILFMPAALSYYLGSGRWKQSASSREKGPSIPIGRIYFSAYVVSLVLYVSIVYLGGRLSFSGGDNDFINTIGINVAFWFLLPVQAGALIVYTLASGKAGGNWVIVIARLALCVIFAFICYSALERLPHTSMFW